VPGNDSSYARAAGFVVGFLLGWVGYALRAGVLPDTGAGRAVAAFLVIAVLTGICAATMGWLPLWSGLLGIAAIAGAYEYAFSIDPTAFTSQSVTAATTVLLAAAVGFLVRAVAAAFVPDEDEHARPAKQPEGAGPTPQAGENAGIQILDKPAEA
jgi:ABC-type transport system involved in cytochrome c biogenesis permease subunit